MRKVRTTKIYDAEPELVLSLFYDQQHLSKWWMVQRSFIELKPGGMYLLTWQIGEHGFGYVSTGTVSDYAQGQHLRVEKMAYLNPKYQILAPMQLDIETRVLSKGTELIVEQSGYLEGSDWDWYYAATKTAWPRALSSIQHYLNQF